MKTITFWVEPICEMQMTCNVPNDVWEQMEQLLEEGKSADEVFWHIRGLYPMEVEKTTIGTPMKAFDFQAVDCDCEK